MNIINPFIFTELPSTQDKAFELAKEQKLPPWGSVLAKKQTAGRGQARKNWVSMEGNLMVSMRLPEVEPFTSQAAAIATSTLVTEALRTLGYTVGLKWPNDPVIFCNGQYCKAGGILIEERDKIIIGGIGLNLINSPRDIITEKVSLAPYFLNVKEDEADPEEFWLKLLSRMQSIYRGYGDFNKSWHEIANLLLIWKGNNIQVEQKNETGTLKGIAENGALIIENDSKLTEITSGSIMLA